MHLTIIGTGFVGVVSAAVFASKGNHVIGLDISEERIASLRQGRVPFYEPDLEKLLVKTQKTGNLSFTTSYKEAISSADVIFIAVGTPSAADGQADLTYVYSASKSLAPFLKRNAIVAIKSTVPPGTCQKVAQIVQRADVAICSLPEFLREGSAVHDTLHPDRIVIGATVPKAIAVLKKLHAPLRAPLLIMKPESAQMAKYAANAYLATRITFINQIANLCEANGANIQEVIRAIGEDQRIGSHYWYPGLGYGGSCFPKDVKELAAYARAIKQEDNLMVTIDALNVARIPSLLARYEKKVGGWKNKKIAVLGLSFKPDSDDMREAPSAKIIPILLKAGASVTGYDPMANESARKILPKIVRIADTWQEATAGANVVFVLIEWSEFKKLKPAAIARSTDKNAWLIDARNQYVPSAVLAADLNYMGVGIQ